MLYAQRLALKLKIPLHVGFCLVPKFLDATIRHFGFMLKGLNQVETECRELDISFHLLIGESQFCIPDLVGKLNLDAVVTDFSPLRVSRLWVENLKAKLPPDIPFCQVFQYNFINFCIIFYSIFSILEMKIDAHNIVPVWVTSNKLEVGARTIRKKIHDKLKEYLTEFLSLIHI